MPGSPEMNDMTASLESTDLPTDAMIQAELAKIQKQMGGQAKMDVMS